MAWTTIYGGHTGGNVDNKCHGKVSFPTSSTRKHDGTVAFPNWTKWFSSLTGNGSEFISSEPYFNDKNSTSDRDTVENWSKDEVNIEALV